MRLLLPVRLLRRLLAKTPSAKDPMVQGRVFKLWGRWLHYRPERRYMRGTR